MTKLFDSEQKVASAQMDTIKRQFAKMRIDLPPEVEAKIELAEEFSRQIKKKLSA